MHEETLRNVFAPGQAPEGTPRGDPQPESPPRVFRSVEEVRNEIGKIVGFSPPFRVTQQKVDAFADLTGDYEWIHVDPVRAALGPFGGTIVHGYLTLSLIARFASEVFRLEFESATLNYGLDKVRFPAPLSTGSLVRAKVSFTSITDHPAGSLVAVRYILEAENVSKPVCIADTLLLALSASDPAR